MNYVNRAGGLALLPISKEEYNDFYKLLNVTRPELYLPLLLTMLGEENTLEFLDAFNGQNIKVPSTENLYTLIQKIKIYRYCKKYSFSELSMENASALFRKKKEIIAEIIKELQEVYKEE